MLPVCPDAIAIRPVDEDSTTRVPAARPRSAAVEIKPAYATARLPNDPDDPAVWVHPTDPSRSLIIGTVKVAAPAGAVVAYGLDGQIRQMIAGIDRPNNVDVEYGVRLGGQPVDIAVATERLARQLRIFRIDRRDGQLTDLGGTPILRSEQGEAGAPMGIALYIARTRQRGVRDCRAQDRAAGRLPLAVPPLRHRRRPPRRHLRSTIRAFSASAVRPENEIEAVAVDDALGYVYYADEANGIHKWHADPDRPDAGRELAHFARTGFRGDREGVAIYALSDGTGYIVCTDQLDGNSEYHVYAREGAPGNPHDHSREIAVVRGGADATDGLEISSAALGPTLPHGIMIAMNSTPQNFLVFRWEDVAAAVKPGLQLDGQPSAR